MGFLFLNELFIHGILEPSSLKCPENSILLDTISAEMVQRWMDSSEYDMFTKGGFSIRLDIDHQLPQIVQQKSNRQSSYNCSACCLVVVLCVCITSFPFSLFDRQGIRKGAKILTLLTFLSPATGLSSIYTNTYVLLASFCLR